MSEVRAFVGHSFTEDDAGVVDTFLKYFDKLARSLPNFSWEHAESAEPKLLTEKVLQRISGKNLFIGICTRKEYAIQRRSPKSLFFAPSFLWVDRREIAWKTSDWIIQEIGLAVGRGLALILLIEEGIRQPGGLQGDVEYISFNRASPEKSFVKIMEMVAALAPRLTEAPIASSDVKSPPVDEKQVEPPADDSWKTPKPNWARREYEFALMHMIALKDAVGAETITKEYLATADAAESDNAASWHAYVEWVRVFWGHDANLAKLRSLALEHPHSVRVLRYYARALREYEKHEEAAQWYQTAAQQAKNRIEKLQLLGQAAVRYSKVKINGSKLELIEQMRAIVREDKHGEAEFLRAIQEMAEVEEDEDKALAAMEQLLNLEPDNTDLRFSLAYKHSQKGDRDLALFHYNAVPAHARAAMAWNNLGVALDEFSIEGKAVEAYQRAADMGETLAMSNVANKLIGAGFLAEAQRECDRALQIKDYHKNVALTLGRLKEVPEGEADKEAEILKRAKPKGHFYQHFGSALMRHFPEHIDELWNGPDCQLVMEWS